MQNGNACSFGPKCKQLYAMLNPSREQNQTQPPEGKSAEKRSKSSFSATLPKKGTEAQDFRWLVLSASSIDDARVGVVGRRGGGRLLLNHISKLAGAGGGARRRDPARTRIRGCFRPSLAPSSPPPPVSLPRVRPGAWGRGRRAARTPPLPPLLSRTKTSPTPRLSQAKQGSPCPPRGLGSSANPRPGNPSETPPAAPLPPRRLLPWRLQVINFCHMTVTPNGVGFAELAGYPQLRAEIGAPGGGRAELARSKCRPHPPCCRSFSTRRTA